LSQQWLELSPLLKGNVEAQAPLNHMEPVILPRLYERTSTCCCRRVPVQSCDLFGEYSTDRASTSGHLSTASGNNGHIIGYAGCACLLREKMKKLPVWKCARTRETDLNI
jgi:hypothetical protein